MWRMHFVRSGVDPGWSLEALLGGSWALAELGGRCGRGALLLSEHKVAQLNRSPPIWTLWLSWIGLPSAQLNTPTDDDSWVEVTIKWQTKQDCLMWKEVILFVWQRVSIFKGKANLARSWLPVSAVTSALNSSQEETGELKTARCWCCQTPVVGQFEASWEEMLSLLSAGHHSQAVCVGVERKIF